MSAALYVAYLGFEARVETREYVFSVRYGGEEPREFLLSIPNEAFLSHRIRYQDAPGICTVRLRRELAGPAAPPAGAHYTITDNEIEEFRAAHAPKPNRSGMYKPDREQ
jgi:hypothetical protein